MESKIKKRLSELDEEETVENNEHKTIISRIKKEREELERKYAELESQKEDLFKNAIECVIFDKLEFTNKYRAQYLRDNEDIVIASRPDGPLTKSLDEFINHIKGSGSNVFIGRGSLIFLFSVFLAERNSSATISYIRTKLNDKFTLLKKVCQYCEAKVIYYNFQVNPKFVPNFIHQIFGENLIEL